MFTDVLSLVIVFCMFFLKTNDFYFLIYFIVNWSILYNIVMASAIYQHESALGIHIKIKK